MEEKPTKRDRSKFLKKFCGNCLHHDVYEYPTSIFCGLLYQTSDDFIVSTLGSCEKWTPSIQECFCVEKALERQDRKHADRQ